MNKKRFAVLIVLIVAVSVYVIATRPPREIVMTGIVTTDEVIVSPEIQGRLSKVLVREGDLVTNGQLLAILEPGTQQADVDFYSKNEQQAASQVAQAEANLRFQEAQTSNQIAQAEANLAAAKAQIALAAADLENARLTFERLDRLKASGAESQEQHDRARTAFDAAKARAESVAKQAAAAEAAVALAKANAEQSSSRRAAVGASVHLAAAANAQKERSMILLSHTEIRAPLSAVVDTRAALPGEVVNPGQAIVTLIDQDNLWVRADIEETYIDRIRLGDKLSVKLPSGAVREGEVYHRSVDADYATQRDVSRTKRDIKTFQIRLRCDNRDRGLAVGMTAYVTLPINSAEKK